MEGIVKTVVASLSRGQVIPTIGKTYLVAVEQVELQSEVGTHTRERHTFDFITAEDSLSEMPLSPGIHGCDDEQRAGVSR